MGGLCLTWQGEQVSLRPGKKQRVLGIMYFTKSFNGFRTGGRTMGWLRNRFIFTRDFLKGWMGCVL